MQMQSVTQNRQHGFAPWVRRAVPIALVGSIGVLSLLFQPVPAGWVDKAPQLAALSPWALRAALLASPMLLVLIAAGVGAAVAHRVALGSVLAGTACTSGWPRGAIRAVASGFALGFALAALDATVSPRLGSDWQALTSASSVSLSSVAVGVLYGGVAEEVILRWGSMSLLAWLATAWLGRERATLAMVLAMVVAAALFSAAHLPAVAAQIDLTSAIVARTLALNGIAGLLYGWMFWRLHLEAAIGAHAATHLGFAAWRVLLA